MEEEGTLKFVRVRATEFQRRIGYYQDLALKQPVFITKDGRDKTVLLSAQEYKRLTDNTRKVQTLAEISDAALKAIEAVERS